MPLSSEFSPVIAQQLMHRSIRAFTSESIPSRTLDLLIQAGQSAASSNFIQAYSVIRVTRPETRSAVATLAGGQHWIERAAEFLVFCADLRRADAACRAHELGEIEGYSEHGLTAVIDTALMAQNLLLAAESLGLGGVFIGAIRNDPARVAELLELPELVTPLFGLCLGWPADDPQVKPRLPYEVVLHQDVYRDPSPRTLADYDARMADYYAARSTNRRSGDWSSTTAGALQGKKREGLLEFMRLRGFFRR